jgi:hypothetical protein
MKYQIEVSTFDGGLNTKNNAGSLPPNQSPDLYNVIFDDYGAVGTRLGQSILNSAAIGSAVIDGLASYKKNSLTSYLVASCGGTIYYASGTTFVAIPSSTALYTAGVDTTFLTSHDFLVVSNGYVKGYKWDGTYFTQLGNSAPSNCSIASGASGVLTGSYTYVLTAVNSHLAESDYGTVCSSATISSGRINITGIPTYAASAGVNYLNLYRNTATVSGVYYLVTAVTNGITSYVDNQADSTLVITVPTDNGIMPKAKFLTQYQGRVFAAGDPSQPMRLYFSEPAEPEKWPSVNYLDINDGDGYPITGISSFSNSIIIQKNDDNGNGSVYLLYIPDSTGATGTDNWYLVKSPSAYGGQSGKALVYFNNLLAFINAKGVYALSGQDLAQSAADSNIGRFAVDSHSFEIEPNIKAMKQSMIKNIAAVNYKNKLWFSVPSASTSTKNDAIFQYDFLRISNSDKNTGAWSVFDAHNINNFAEHAGNLYGGSSVANGYVYQLDTGYNDVSSAINSYYLTSGINGLQEHKDNQKVWRFLIVWYEATGVWNLKVEYLLDYGVTYSDPIYINLTSGGSIWGTAIYNVSNWGGGITKKKAKVGLFGAISRDIQFKFSTDTASQYWKIHKIQVLYNIRSIR